MELRRAHIIRTGPPQHAGVTPLTLAVGEAGIVALRLCDNGYLSVCGEKGNFLTSPANVVWVEPSSALSRNQPPTQLSDDDGSAPDPSLSAPADLPASASVVSKPEAPVAAATMPAPPAASRLVRYRRDK